MIHITHFVHLFWVYITNWKLDLNSLTMNGQELLLLEKKNPTLYQVNHIFVPLNSVFIPQQVMDYLSGDTRKIYISA